MKRASSVCRAFLVLLAAAVPALSFAAEEPAQHEDRAEAVKPLPAEQSPEEERVVDIHEEKGGYLGYRFLSTEGYGGRALDYGFLHSSKSGGLFYTRLDRENKFMLDGEFLNDKEYYGDLVYDYRGEYRLHLRTESLFHNLDRQILFSPNFTVNTPAGPLGFTAVQDAPAQYGVEVSQDLATFRYRMHDFPLHVNLGYWKMLREGTVQQRFADVTFESANNLIYAVPRELRNQTQEGSIGVDAHLGWVDLVYLFQVRLFEDRAPIPTASYQAQGAPDVRAAGVMQRNEEPESRLISHTIKAHTTLSDGIVASASYSLSTRENLSRLTDTVGARHGKTTVQNAAGDFFYTPCKEFTAALKYRRQELDREGFAGVTNLFFAEQKPLRPGVESTKDLFIGTFSVRPALNLSLTAEYRGELLNRSNVSALPNLDATWGLPEDSTTHTGSLAFFYRPVKGSRLTGKYTYQTTDHPSYGSCFQQRHQGELLGTYTGKRWGASANLIVKREWNDELRRFVFSSADPLTFADQSSLRERRVQNANLSLWYAPTARVNLTAQYAYVHTVIDQSVLFTSFLPPETASTFRSRARVLGGGATFTATEKLELGANLRWIWTSSSFDPQLVIGTPGDIFTLDTQGISQITAQDTTITHVSLRGGYRITPELSASVEYTLRDYDEKNPVYSGYNGTVHAVVGYLSTRW